MEPEEHFSNPLPPFFDVTEQFDSFLNLPWHDFIDKGNMTRQQIIELIEKSDLAGKFLQKEYDNGKFLYIQSSSLGISLQIENGFLNCIYLYGNGHRQFDEFKGSLPSYLEGWSMKSAEIVGLLGEPSEKSGGGLTQISMSYNFLGLELSFRSKRWQDKECLLDFIALFKRENKAKQCGFCQKSSSNQCARCRAVYYCSDVCQKNHFEMHKAPCIAYAARQTKNLNND